MASDGWIGVDLDGTLAYYDRWRGIGHIGKPIAPMIKRVRTWLAEGREVRIFTARVSQHEHDEICRAVQGFIEKWCQEHIGQMLPVTNVKDFHMIELWDDRAVQVEKNTGQLVGYSTRNL